MIYWSLVYSFKWRLNWVLKVWSRPKCRPTTRYTRSQYWSMSSAMTTFRSVSSWFAVGATLIVCRLTVAAQLNSETIDHCFGVGGRPHPQRTDPIPHRHHLWWRWGSASVGRTVGLIHAPHWRTGICLRSFAATRIFGHRGGDCGQR